MLKTKQTLAHLLRAFSMLLLCALVTPALTSCGDDDEPEDPNETTDLTSIVGTWNCSSSYNNSENGSYTEIQMVLTFNSDHTGIITETWTTQSRAETSSKYQMTFNWASTTNANGVDILKISYVSGDRNTELFYGGSNTVLWQRVYVLTGNILNITEAEGNDVWVFHRQ